MSQKEVRYKAIPSTWPPNSVVFVDFPNGISRQYSTDTKGVPSFVNQYTTDVFENLVDEDIVSDGTGVVTLADDYTPGTWRVTLRGALVRKTDVTETSSNSLTLAVTTRAGDFINVQYLPL